MIDSTTWPPELRQVFRKLVAWLETYGLEKTEKKQTCSFNLPEIWKAGNPLVSVEYMATKGGPYVELRFYYYVITRLQLQQDFLAIWTKITAISERSDFSVSADVTPKKEYKISFTPEAGNQVSLIVKLLTPFMNTAMKVIKDGSA
jgi:hypothetical protein